MMVMRACIRHDGVLLDVVWVGVCGCGCVRVCSCVPCLHLHQRAPPGMGDYQSVYQQHWVSVTPPGYMCVCDHAVTPTPREGLSTETQVMNVCFPPPAHRPGDSKQCCKVHNVLFSSVPGTARSGCSAMTLHECRRILYVSLSLSLTHTLSLSERRLASMTTIFCVVA